MDQGKMFGLVAIAGFVLSIAGNSAVARQESLKDHLVGTWMVASCEVVNADGTRGPLVFGRNPLGQFIFTDNWPLRISNSGRTAEVRIRRL
jgi:hypothetical protein